MAGVGEQCGESRRLVQIEHEPAWDRKRVVRARTPGSAFDPFSAVHTTVTSGETDQWQRPAGVNAEPWRPCRTLSEACRRNSSMGVDVTDIDRAVRLLLRGRLGRSCRPSLRCGDL